MLPFRVIHKNPIFCFGIDDKFVWPLMVALFSAKKKMPKLKTVYILYYPQLLSDEMISFVEKNCKKFKLKPKFIACELMAKTVASGHITNSSYLRFEIPKIFQGKVIWLDADLLFFDKWQEITDYFYSRSHRIETIQARCHWHDPKSITNKAITVSKSKYFNSGVMLINTKKWREKKISNQLALILENYEDYGFEWADQCVLNYYFEGNYGSIDLKYNSIPEEYQSNETRILHFAGSHKPWTFRVDNSGEVIPTTHWEILTGMPISDRITFTLYRRLEIELYGKIFPERAPLPIFPSILINLFSFLTFSKTGICKQDPMILICEYYNNVYS
jgi:lipopolysaccharide biosynthesis glycosyltransferase